MKIFKVTKIVSLCLSLLLSTVPVLAQEIPIVRQIFLKGNTVLTPEEIDIIVSPYLNQPFDVDRLLLLQQQLTQAYLDRGFFTSFVTLEGQTSDGIVTFTAIEGTAKVEVEARGIRRDYIESKINRFLDRPLNQQSLEEGLSLLQLDPLVRDLSATIAPSENPGQNILTIRAVANPSWSIGAEISNDENPVIGSWGVRGFIENNNLAGGGEQLRAEYKVTEGLDRWLVGATIPILPTNSRIELTYQQSNSEIVDGFFKDFNIENDSYVALVRFTHPFLQKFNKSFDLGFGVEHRESQSFVLADELFSNVRLTAIRIDQTYIKRSSNSLAIILSQFSIGFSNQEVDPTFFHWQGQGQFLYNFGIGQIYTRLALQLSPNTLPIIEQCAIGGRNGNQFIFGNTVRGYTTNARTGDSCVASTLEVRFPFYKNDDVEVSGFPFLDFGYVWTSRGQSLNPPTLIGTGVGIRFSYREQLLIQSNYGLALNDPDSDFDEITQGLSFSILGQFRF